MLNILPTFKTQSAWCWTKSMANDPTYVFDAKKGGINWGYCEKPKEKIETVPYDITVDTSKLPKSGSDSTLKIQIFGTLGATQEKFLGKKFEEGSTKELTINDTDVGDVNKIIVRIYGRNDYRCKDIKISVGPNNYVFNCLKKLKPCTLATNQFICQEEILPEGDTAYEITLKTSDDEDAGTTSPMLIGLVGEKGISPNQMLSETGAASGSQIQTVIKVDELGVITGYYIELTDPGKWKGSYMIIKTIKNGAIAQMDLKEVALTNPGLAFKKFDSSPEPLTGDNLPDDESLKVNEKGLIGKGKGGFNTMVMIHEEKEEDENDTIIQFAKYETGDENAIDKVDFVASASVSADASGLNINKVGGVIDSGEAKGIVDLDCTQKLINPDASNQLFGPDYPTSNVMYSKMLIRCPVGCHKVQGFVYGVGLHPEVSPICLSALVDNAISVYGGIIQISIFPGLDKYIINKAVTQIHKIKINNFTGHSNKSYVISKVDNIDLVEKDIRILDDKGINTHTGRLEVRLNGKWGTICRLRNNEESARRICLDLGYQDGKWLKEDCITFKGKDYCGSELYKSMFSDITCDHKDTSLNTCMKKPANKNECPHTEDVLISCTNIAKDSILTPLGNLRLENVSKSHDDHTGRLESYFKDKHIPICNKQFDLAAAIVSCKQMGYDSGEIYHDKRGKYHNAEDDHSIPFAATDIKCKGEESALSECSQKTSNIDCTHDNDVVLTCSGKKGDPSGKSQIHALTQNILTPAALGKLSLLKFKIDCRVKGNDSRFRGDAGSVYLVHCPANCSKEKGQLFGLGMYTTDSSVCQAGIHAGVINDEKGGVIAYTKMWGNGYYIGAEKNGLSSAEINSPFPISFSVQGKSSGWENMWHIWRENYGGVYLEEEKQMKEVPQKESRFNMRKKYNKKQSLIISPEEIRESSFMETNVYSSMLTTYIPDPVFEWIEFNPSHIFNDRDNKVKLADKKIKPMKKYNILMRLKMTEFKQKKAFLFSTGGCFHFNIYVDKSDNLVFGDPCNTKDQINTGINMPVNDRTIIHVFYDESNLKLTIFSEKLQKPIVKNYSKTLEIGDSSMLSIGKRPDSNDSFYYGFLDFIQIYDSEIHLNKINTIIDSLQNKAKQPTVLKKRNTLDKRDCITACAADPTPGKPGSTSPPKDADPYANDDTKNVPLKPKTSEDVKMEITNAAFHYSAAYFMKFGTYDHSEVGNMESIEINCTTTLKDKRFNGSVGKIFRVKCPTCKSVKRPVYGSFIFHPLSSICKAGVHAGHLKIDGPGYLLVELNSGRRIYNGSQGADKSISSTFSKSKISFRTKKASPPTKITCEDTPANAPFNTSAVGTKFVVICPKKCSEKQSLKVYGADFYTDKSSICVAGIHNGVMNDRGGELEFMIESGQSYYKGTRSFGIISKSRDAYVRSFKFIGAKNRVSYKFREDYNSIITEKWDIKQFHAVKEAKGNMWEYIDLTYLDKNTNQSKKTRAIHHKGRMKGLSKNDFGTFLILKDVEWNNSIIKSNFYFKDSNLFAFLFRFSDQNNYYSIEIDPKEVRDNVRLVVKSNGSSKTIKQATLVLSLITWYRITLIITNDNIKVFIQTDNIRENKPIFETNLEDNARGTIGYASNGNYEFYIDGIEVDDYIPHESNKMNNSNRRSWNGYLKHVEQKVIKKFCMVLFKADEEENQRCRMPSNFCRMKCDDYVPVVENILNFHCYKDCFAKIITKDNEIKVKKESWKPKIGDRVDFLPKGMKKYSASTIISAQTKKTNKKIEIYTVTYITSDGAQKTTTAEFPSQQIKKCGTELPKRKDCS